MIDIISNELGVYTLIDGHRMVLRIARQRRDNCINLHKTCVFCPLQTSRVNRTQHIDQRVQGGQRLRRYFVECVVDS